MAKPRELTMKFVANTGEKITVKPLVYQLNRGQYKINATIHDNGRITLNNIDKVGTEFNFINSTREVIKAIGELLIEASKIK